MAIVRHMEFQGEIDNSLMAPPTAGGGQAVCANQNRYIINPQLGNSALATTCGCVPAGAGQLPNVRIEVGVGAIRDPVSLQSSLFHEFRHVRQAHERCTLNPSGSGHGGIVTDCNSPEEMDAYLSEAEGGYNPPSVRHAWVRVYVNWPYLAPEQQQVFMARQRNVRQKVDRLFPGVDWANDTEVGTYSAFCQQLQQSVGTDTHGTADSPLAPLSSPGPRSGGPVPAPPPPVGDFPMPPEGERVA
jgi:hypothetical protein